MIDLGYIAAGDEDPYLPLTIRDTRHKETHLHRPKGGSRRFDGTAWYLEDGLALPISVASASTSSRVIETESDGEASPQLLAGTQTLKRAGFTKSPRPVKHRAPDEEPASDSGSEPGGADKEKQQKSANKKKPNKKPKKTDSWIWLETMVGREGSTNDKMKEYREESDRVQWFRAEAEMYCWHEQYECKHAELLRVMTRFGQDTEVWSKCAAHLEQTVKSPGAVTYAREQAAMYKHLQHNSRITFKSTESAAHAEWIAATSFGDLVARIDASRDTDFKWMDDLLLAKILALTRPSPTPQNPMHRTAGSSQVYAEYCRQHATDSRLLPLARACGWPEEIDYSHLRERVVITVLPTLQDMLEDIQASDFYHDSISGEFKKSTAYFGDLGYHVIFRAVLEYFPALAIVTDYAPLSHARLVEEVLVPEAMVSLISEELGVNHEEAIEIMETSAEFGLYYHSDIHDRLRSGSSIEADPPSDPSPQPLPPQGSQSLAFPLPSPLHSPAVSPVKLKPASWNDFEL
ncbi:hypothetical protein B0H14DRAFT_3448040 [Mycena olivaceomarginata]|nr:hypothetical protein B0H14DRAFT_3448040 [Mycena olivaceomarginata]